MKEIKLKLFSIIAVSILGITSIIYTYKKNSTFAEKLTLEQIGSVKESLNLILSHGCIKTFQNMKFNNAKNFVSVKIKEIEMNGSVSNFSLMKGLNLFEYNLESQKNAIKLRGYLFENQLKKTCFGMVL